MFRRVLLSVLALAFFLPVASIKADNDGRFAIVALSPTGQKTACVQKGNTTLLQALQKNNFSPKQDDTGFIYSLIGHDGPVSSNPAAQQAFWGLWISQNNGLLFSDLGPSLINPDANKLYVFSFGSGQTPTSYPPFGSICSSPTPPPSPSPTPSPTPSSPSLSAALSYLQTNYASQSASNRDWAAIGLGENNISATPSTSSGQTILSLERNVLARAAQGADRSTLIDQIKASYRDGQLGDPALINDDIFGILAIQSTDSSWLTSRQDIFTTIINSQRANGSFGFSKTGDGDTDMTAAAIWALVYKTSSPTEILSKASTYLDSAKNTDGGYGFRPGTASSVATSSWVILARVSLNKDTSDTRQYLLSQQHSSGYWLQGTQANYLNTAYAVMALSGKKLPYVKNSVTPPPTSGGDQPSGSSNSQANSSASAASGSTAKRKTIKQPAQQIVTETVTVTCSASASASASASGTNASASASASASCN